MMFLLRDDRVLETFPSPEEPPTWIEWIDVENEEYEFCNDLGQKYRGVLVSGSRFAPSKWELRPEGEAAAVHAISLLNKAVAVETHRCAFSDLPAAQRHITSIRYPAVIQAPKQPLPIDYASPPPQAKKRHLFFIACGTLGLLFGLFAPTMSKYKPSRTQPVSPPATAPVPVPNAG